MPNNINQADLEWGTLITTPTGHINCEPASGGHGHAANLVHNLNEDRPGTASLIYREVTYGDWSTATTGNQFGVRYEWPDGGQEIHEVKTRLDADRMVRLNNGGAVVATATVMSRQVEYGQWWVAEGQATR